MPTVTKSIGSAGGRDYSTIAAWAAALPANLVTDGNSQQGECYNDSEFSSASTLLTLSGHTTDASHTITLTTGVGQGFRDNANAQTNALKYNQANGVGVSLTADYTIALDIQNSNVFISKLQIKSAAGSQAFKSSSTGGAVVVDGCIFEGGDQGAGTAVVQMSGSAQKIRNSLVIGVRSNGSAILSCSDGMTVANCTVVAASDIATPPQNGLASAYSVTSVENCAIFGATAVASVGSLTNLSFTTCMTDVATPPSGCTQVAYGDQFVNTTTAAKDFKLKAGANCLDAGTTDTTNGTPDIVGTARPQGSAYDISAWELVAASPPVGGPSNVYFDTIF